MQSQPAGNAGRAMPWLLPHSRSSSAGAWHSYGCTCPATKPLVNNRSRSQISCILSLLGGLCLSCFHLLVRPLQAHGNSNGCTCPEYIVCANALLPSLLPLGLLSIPTRPQGPHTCYREIVFASSSSVTMDAKMSAIAL